MTRLSSAIGVLALQGAVEAHQRVFESLRVSTVPVRTREELAGVDALVIPGGESTAMSRLAIDLGMLAPVAERIKSGMPTFGTCAGLIMLADRVLDGRPDQRQFGGLDLTVRRNAFGRQVESFEMSVDMPIVGPPGFPGVFIRSPWVESVGADVEILGSIQTPTDTATHTADGAGHRIVAVRQGNVLATAFHPEIVGDVRLHELFLSMIT